ncbi:hypothetical protein ACLBXO_26710 [Methylobacterium sp. C33D]
MIDGHCPVPQVRGTGSVKGEDNRTVDMALPINFRATSPTGEVRVMRTAGEA